MSRVEVDYEGMGTCIEATISVDGKNVCVIGACGPTTNELTRKAVEGAMNALKEPKKKVKK